MMSRRGGRPAISPLISTSDVNITTQLFIIALEMNYGENTRGIQFSFKSIFQSLLSVKGTLQTIIYPFKKWIISLLLCFFFFPPVPTSATQVIAFIKKGSTQLEGKGRRSEVFTPEREKYDNEERISLIGKTPNVEHIFGRNEMFPAKNKSNYMFCLFLRYSCSLNI